MIFHTIKNDHELYIFHNGELIYKKWFDPKTKKKKASMIFNEQFPNERIVHKKEIQ